MVVKNENEEASHNGPGIAHGGTTDSRFDREAEVQHEEDRRSGKAEAAANESCTAQISTGKNGDLMNDKIYDQLARSGVLPDELSGAILSGIVPPLEDIVMPLVICSMDCEALTYGDAKSTWNEKRIARQCLVIAFLAAILAGQGRT